MKTTERSVFISEATEIIWFGSREVKILLNIFASK